MRHLDRRLRSIAAWEKVSGTGPSFILSVRWKPAGLTIRQVMDPQLEASTRTRPIMTDKDLVLDRRRRMG